MKFSDKEYKSLYKFKTDEHIEEYKKILLYTAFLDEYFKFIQWPQRLHHYLNGITDIPKCSFCDKRSSWRRNEYTKTCGEYDCRMKARIETNNIKYGCDHSFQNKDVKEKINKAFDEKYGSHHMKNESFVKDLKIKCLKETGYAYYHQQNKSKEKRVKTNELRFGKKNISSVQEIKDKKQKSIKKHFGNIGYGHKSIIEKRKETSIKKYGVPHKNMLKEERERMSILASSRTTPDGVFKVIYDSYKNTDLNYQGSYEKDFLDNYYELLRIENSKRIKYDYDGIERNYTPDFYLPDFNLVVEIKSDWTFNKWKDKNLAKEQACLQQGFDFIFIFNKDYTEFELKLASIMKKPESFIKS